MQDNEDRTAEPAPPTEHDVSALIQAALYEARSIHKSVRGLLDDEVAKLEQIAEAIPDPHRRKFTEQLDVDGLKQNLNAIVTNVTGVRVRLINAEEFVADAFHGRPR